MTLKGIDISHWDDGVNLGVLDIDFCIVKATQGYDFVDNCFDRYIDDCKRSGSLYGFYHYANSNSDPVREAEFFYSKTKHLIGLGIPVLDYEEENGIGNANWCEQFIQTYYELSGVWCVLYISAYRCAEYAKSWIPEKCGLWVAGYPSEYSYWVDRPYPYDVSPWPFAAIWQFTSSLQIPGYTGTLDADYAYMSRDAWMKYAAPNDKPQPVPQPTNDLNNAITVMANAVIAGKFGNGEARKNALYDTIQSRVNQLLGA